MERGERYWGDLMERAVQLLTPLPVAVLVSLALLSPAAAAGNLFIGTLIIAEPQGVALFGTGLLAFCAAIRLRRWRARRTLGRRGMQTRRPWHRVRRIAWL
jgi:hypothetical protein